MEIERERLIEILNERGLSIRDLGELTGISFSTIARYIKGLRSPKYEQVCSIANALGVDPDWLAGKDVPIRTEDDTKLMREIAESMNGLSERQLVLLLAYIKLLRGDNESS